MPQASNKSTAQAWQLPSLPRSYLLLFLGKCCLDRSLRLRAWLWKQDPGQLCILTFQPLINSLYSQKRNKCERKHINTLPGIRFRDFFSKGSSAGWATQLQSSKGYLNAPPFPSLLIQSREAYRPSSSGGP